MKGQIWKTDGFWFSQFIADFSLTHLPLLKVQLNLCHCLVLTDSKTPLWFNVYGEKLFFLGLYESAFASPQTHFQSL